MGIYVNGNKEIDDMYSVFGHLEYVEIIVNPL